MAEQTWNQRATNLLKSQMVLAGVSYEGLIERLAAIGVDESYKGIANKINRGAFSFVFFMQCMKVLGVNEMRL
ncbi:DUF6471 domain-containing protein [Gallaecimonas kandeliae]|uniref:DUF6471 domain-containing protein n=1 Tax=Gallaecimonas kandeliae TaxID=3029055 RepID=UPI002647B6F1|nr:DUF6471 domain-containing protein [Gallaecimonas kandeliae]WKE65781.1 DUF6471 domain-containing protein [Gallaecimonas kandeliae]